MKARLAVTWVGVGLARRTLWAADLNELEVDKAHPDFTVVTLPPDLRVPAHRLAFRLTHHCARPMSSDDSGELGADFCGFDGGAKAGMALRFRMLDAPQLAVYRIADNTIQFSLRRELAPRGRRPRRLSTELAVHGLDSATDEISPAISVVVWQKSGARGRVCVSPTSIANALWSPRCGDDSTVVLGLGARLQLESSPVSWAKSGGAPEGFRRRRASRGAKPLLSFGLEPRLGGRVLQMSQARDLDDSPAWMPQGQQGVEGWFVGFNLSRRPY
jgi:hypothetical protein